MTTKFRTKIVRGKSYLLAVSAKGMQMVKNMNQPAEYQRKPLFAL